MSANPQVQSWLDQTPQSDIGNYWEWKAKERQERLALAVRAFEYINEVMCDPPDTEDRRRIGEYCKATALDLSKVNEPARDFDEGNAKRDAIDSTGDF